MTAKLTACGEEQLLTSRWNGHALRNSASSNGPAGKYLHKSTLNGNLANWCLIIWTMKPPRHWKQIDILWICLPRCPQLVIDTDPKLMCCTAGFGQNKALTFKFYLCNFIPCIIILPILPNTPWIEKNTYYYSNISNGTGFWYLLP